MAGPSDGDESSSNSHSVPWIYAYSIDHNATDDVDDEPEPDEEDEENEDDEEGEDDEGEEGEGEVDEDEYDDEDEDEWEEYEDDEEDEEDFIFHLANTNDHGGLGVRLVVQDENEPSIEDIRLLAILQASHRSGMFSRQDMMAYFRERDIVDGRRQRKDPNRFPKVPSEEGAKLMCSGMFGTTECDLRTEKRIARRLLDRELGIGDGNQRRRNNAMLAQSLIPGTNADQIIHYDQPIYSGQFSDDGNFFFSCCRDFDVRMYDTSNPYNWKHYKTVSYPWGQWTLTDASLSPDNKWLAYTSIQSVVSIAPTNPKDTGDPYSLELDDGSGASRHLFWRGGGSFGIWSIRFSGDGRELVAGTSAHSIVVYDIQSRKVLHHIDGHDDDVNAVCFADKYSPHIIYSGSDDTTIKVWDRRSMGDKREAAAFVGHIEGLTYIDSKGDGRYILSNGKDQSMKLWDLRMAMSTDRFREVYAGNRHNRIARFDYRAEDYDEDEWDVHPHDNSVVTFRGHKVLRTLIRCHFSPPSATNSRYVYSGSADGKVYIWNLDATKAGVIDVKKATEDTRRWERRSRMMFLDEAAGWETCVRDASWHPSAPVLVASAWNGHGMARGTCSIHSFNECDDDEGEPRMGRSVNHKLESDDEMYYPGNRS